MTETPEPLPVRQGFFAALKRALRPRQLPDHIATLIRQEGCRTILDLGSGSAALWRQIDPALDVTGVEADLPSVERARIAGTHDRVLHADILAVRSADILAAAGVAAFDLVALLDVIEHLPKRRGFELLERCEELTRGFVVVSTPNGFLSQGPEFGNPFQRHLSGWFIHDFTGLGYTVRGVDGPRFFHAYAGAYRFRFPGVRRCDLLLGRLLRIERNPGRAAALLAWKDVRGVPARL